MSDFVQPQLLFSLLKRRIETGVTSPCLNSRWLDGFGVIVGWNSRLCSCSHELRLNSTASSSLLLWFPSWNKRNKMRKHGPTNTFVRHKLICSGDRQSYSSLCGGGGYLFNLFEHQTYRLKNQSSPTFFHMDMKFNWTGSKWNVLLMFVYRWYTVIKIRYHTQAMLIFIFIRQHFHMFASMCCWWQYSTGWFIKNDCTVEAEWLGKFMSFSFFPIFVYWVWNITLHTEKQQPTATHPPTAKCSKVS